MQGYVKKWGNSAAVRIPSAVLEAAAVRLDEPVDVREEDGRIIIEKVRATKYELDALVAGISDTNLHEPVDLGGPVGREAR